MAGQDLDGAVAIVTGAGSGIGRQIAVELRDAGAAVVAADIDGSAADATAAIPGDGVIHPRQIDVTSPDQVEALVRGVVAELGRIDLVVNCAGIYHVAPLLEHPFEAWNRVFGVNLHGPFLLSTAAGRVMVGQEPHPVLGRRGQIINVSSGAAIIGRPVLASYGASKAALNHLTMSLAAAFEDQGVVATIFYPGNVEAGMWGRIGPELATAQGRPVEEVVAERVFQPVERTAEIAVWAFTQTGEGLNGMAVRDVGSYGPITEGVPKEILPPT